MHVGNNFCQHEHLSFVRAVPENILTSIREVGKGEIEEKKLEKKDEDGEIRGRKMFINEHSCRNTDNFLNYKSVMTTMMEVLYLCFNVL